MPLSASGVGRSTIPGKAEDACRAALGIRAAFEEFGKRPLTRSTASAVGIGIASGRAVAGGIGTAGTSESDGLRPVVNLASRLQDMTKLLRVPILIDEPTAAGRSRTSAARRGPRPPAGEGEALRAGYAAHGDGTDAARRGGRVALE